MNYDKEQFEKDYYSLSYKDLMKKYNISKQTIVNRADTLGLTLKSFVGGKIPIGFNKYIQGHTQKEAMAKYRISHNTLRRWFRRIGYSKYPYSGLAAKIDVEEFKQLYKSNTQDKLATMYGVHKQTIRYWAKQLEIK